MVDADLLPSGPFARLEHLSGRWRRLVARALARGFEDALAGAPCEPPYRTEGPREDYRSGFEFGVRTLEEAAP